MNEKELKNIQEVVEAARQCWVEVLNDKKATITEDQTELTKEFALWMIDYVWCDVEDNNDKDEQTEWLTRMVERVLPKGNVKLVAGIVDMLLYRAVDVIERPNLVKDQFGVEHTIDYYTVGSDENE